MFSAQSKYPMDGLFEMVRAANHVANILDKGGKMLFYSFLIVLLLQQGAPNKSSLKRKRYFDFQFEGTVHHAGEVLTGGAEGILSHCTHIQGAENKKCQCSG